jgi:hypothetical protein
MGTMIHDVHIIDDVLLRGPLDNVVITVQPSTHGEFPSTAINDVGRVSDIFAWVEGSEITLPPLTHNLAL